ncbi:MAG: hypothetical protein M1826_001476 [Phylliscum demangeonii]|nr:MAG: hypothetical protein M1826_001476 [Phylliscum demangeonii]
MSEKIEAMLKPVHPYYPLETELVGYLVNEFSVSTLLATFFGTCVVFLGLADALINRVNRRLSTGNKLTALWFALCTSFGTFPSLARALVADLRASSQVVSSMSSSKASPPGYFALNHTRIASADHLLGQMWKEYAHADSRYLTSDSAVLCIEAITAACWGPLSFLATWLIATDHPLRHALQAMVSLGQLYGDVIYFATCFFDRYHRGVSYSRPEAFYYVGYFLFLNGLWIVIPGPAVR